MEHPNSIDTLRDAIAAALSAQDDLLEVWQRIDPTSLAAMNTPGDIEKLTQLIIRRIYPLQAFEALARIEPSAATDMLLSRYLGVGVDPDRKFGGYSFELEAMLDDLREIAGEKALIGLVRHQQFAKDRLKDRRVLDAFAEALNIPAERVQDWAEK